MADTEALQQGDLLGGLGLRGFDLGIGTIGNILIWVLISVLIVGLICGVIIYFYYKKLYGQNVNIFSMIGNTPTFKEKSKARYIRMGTAGDSLFFIKSRKKYSAPPTIQMGKKTWWFWERSDGELINFGLKDLNEQMKKSGAYFVDTDMRMQRLGIEKNLRDRFIKEKFWDKYGTAIVGALFVILVTVSLVVLFAKLVDVSEALTRTAEAVQSMAGSVDRFYEEKVGERPEGASNLVPAFALLMFRRYKWKR